MQKVIAIIGPTATGKSALAVRLARAYNGEVISADSRQVYKGLDIGTGKITQKEVQGVPHHLLDVVAPKKQFTVTEFQKLAKQKIEEIHSRGKLPIICGGTGLYIDTLLRGTSIPEVPPNLKLRKQLEKRSAPELFKMLQKMDERRAETIDQHNPRRLVRAIEIAQALGKVPLLQHSHILKNVRMLFIGLTLPSEALRMKISRRLHKRMMGGMIREAKKLHVGGLSWKRMEELGLEYRYLSRFLQKKITRTELTVELEKEIYHYAKRQMTWFKRNKEIKWYTPNEANKIKKAVRGFTKTSP